MRESLNTRRLVLRYHLATVILYATLTTELPFASRQRIHRALNTFAPLLNSPPPRLSPSPFTAVTTRDDLQPWGSEICYISKTSTRYRELVPLRPLRRASLQRLLVPHSKYQGSTTTYQFAPSSRLFGMPQRRDHRPVNTQIRPQHKARPRPRQTAAIFLPAPLSQVCQECQPTIRHQSPGAHLMCNRCSWIVRRW